MAIRTIYIEYKESGVLTDPFAVTLDSDPALSFPIFGIRRADSGEIIVPAGTAVNNPSVGRYEYDIDLLDGVLYSASWEVYPTAISAPRYIIQPVGPFYTSTETGVNAVPTYKGTLIQGQTTIFMLKITDMEGNPIDPTSINFIISDDNNIPVSVTDSNGNSSTTTIPEKAASGFYVFDWAIPETQDSGDYLIVWTYTVNGVVKTATEAFTIATDSADSYLYSGMAAQLIAGLESYIRCAQCIPVYFEQNRPSIDQTTFQFTFKNWNQTPGIRVYRNKTQLIESGYTVNYFTGEITFSTPLTIYDTIYADYNFRWFTDQQLYDFIANAVRTLNSFPPASPQYTLESVPDRYIPAILKQAAVDAFRQLMLCLQFQQPQQVFGGSEGAQNAFSNIDTLKKNYEEELKTIYEQKKFGPYPSSRIIVPTVMAMPGGRSRWFRSLFCNTNGG